MISRARTDSEGAFDLKDRQSGIGNLVRIFSALTGLGEGTVVWEYEHRGYGAFKKDLAEVVAEALAPIRMEFLRLQSKQDFLRDCLKKGREKALEKSGENYGKIKEAVGFIPC